MTLGIHKAMIALYIQYWYCYYTMSILFNFTNVNVIVVDDDGFETI